MLKKDLVTAYLVGWKSSSSSLVVLKASFAWKTERRRHNSKVQILTKSRMVPILVFSVLMKFGRRLAREKPKTARAVTNFMRALLVIERYFEA